MPIKLVSNKSGQQTSDDLFEYIQILKKQMLKSRDPEKLKKLISKKQEELKEAHWNEFLAK